MTTAPCETADRTLCAPTCLPPLQLWAKNTLLGAVFAGAMVGMVVMGSVGDVLGRRAGMLLTLSFVVVGALASALFSWGDATTVYTVITVARFFLGVGVGGIYPMAAATAAEAQRGAGDDDDKENVGADDDGSKASAVGWAFFWQMPGAMAPYAIAWLLLHALPGQSSAQFRLLLALGALPSGIVAVATWYTARPAAGEVGGKPLGGGAAEQRVSPLSLATKEHWTTLVGTAGSWFLYDVAFYGTNVFTPTILTSIFGASESLDAVCWQSLVVSSMGVPAAVASIMLLKSWGGRTLNIVGFVAQAVFFAGMAALYTVKPDAGAATGLKFATFCALTLALNFGPNVATYVLPAQLFPPNVRGTFHGLSAAAGKAGALAGTFAFPPLSSAAGLASVMWAQAVLCVIAALVSAYFIAPLRPAEGFSKVPDDDDDAPKVARR